MPSPFSPVRSSVGMALALCVLLAAGCTASPAWAQEGESTTTTEATPSTVVPDDTTTTTSSPGSPPSTTTTAFSVTTTAPPTAVPDCFQAGLANEALPDEGNPECVAAWSSGKNAGVQLDDEEQRDRDVRKPPFVALCVLAFLNAAMLVTLWRRR